MICPHCAFPNDPGTSVCVKCKHSMDEPPVDACESSVSPGWLQKPVSASAQPGADSRSEISLRGDQIAGEPDPHPSASGELDRARRMEADGDLRGAFVTCQSILMDHLESLPDDMLAKIYLTMGRVSLAQDKPDRARKYLGKAGSLDPDLVQVPPPEGRGNTKVASRIPKPRSVQGRLAWVASFWGRVIAFALDALLVSGLLAAMLALAALVLGYDGEQVVEALAGGLTNLVVMSMLFFLLLLTYVTVFVRFGGQTLGKMLLGLRVVRLDGHSLTTWHAVRRAVGMLLAGLPGLGGFVWAAFDLNRRGWHDRIGGTLVVCIRPPRSALAPTISKPLASRRLDLR